MKNVVTLCPKSTPRDRYQTESETCRGSAAQCTGRSLRQPEALPRLKVAHQLINISCCRSEYRAMHAPSSERGKSREEKGRERKHSVDRNPRTSGTTESTHLRCTQPQSEITKGRTDGLGSQLLYKYYTHMALPNARTQEELHDSKVESQKSKTHDELDTTSSSHHISAS